MEVFHEHSLFLILAIKSVKFFDKYGSRVTVAYDGGYALIQCDGLNCEIGEGTQLIGPASTQILAECKDNKATFHLDINVNTKFSEYKCDDDGWKLSYRLCKCDFSFCQFHY